MNIRNRRGIENLLLRRVRRHQSMTALFRAPGADAGRLRPRQALPVIQKQEQDLPIDMSAAETRPSLPVTPAPSKTVTRQIAPPSEPKPFPSLPSTPVEKTPDPAWKRLQTIFRKHEEQHDASAEDATASIQMQPYEEKGSPQETTIEDHTLATRSQDVTVPEAKTIQRSSETVEPKSASRSFDAPSKVQPLPSTKPEVNEPATTRNVEFKPDLPGEVHEQVAIHHEPEDISIPLESVWNVQRVEAPHPLFNENIPHPILDSTNVAGNEASLEASPVHAQKPTLGPIQLRHEDNSASETQISDSLPASEQIEESHEPVEILSPSRPRPAQMDLPAKNANVQRQSQDHATSQKQSTAKEVSEASPVNTAIGPLPADLWWLLGQKPPSTAPTSQPEIQRTIQSDQQPVPSEQRNAIPAEHPVETPVAPNMIQRQALSSDALPAVQKETVSSTRAADTKPVEPDLDDLVRRVYAEVRRRLAAEWERRR